MIQIAVKIDQAWVLSNRTAKRLPADVVADYFGNSYAGKITSKSFTEVVFCSNSDAISTDETKSLEQRVTQCLREAFQTADGSLDGIICVEIKNVEGEVLPENAPPQKAPEADAAPAEPQRPEAAPEPPKPAALEIIRRRKGSRQFIDLCEDIHMLAPKYRERSLQNVFFSASYIFSIDSGCGLTSTLELFRKLLEEEQLCNLKRTLEIVVPAQDRKEDVLKQMSEQLSHLDKTLVSIDISNWTDHLSTPEFRDFLMVLQEKTRNNIYVFRAPYLEQTVLEDIAYALDDVMRVQTVAFVPLNAEELRALAEGMLSGYGFTMEPEAWEVFQQRVIEEKSDGRFYGVKTVEKIVDDIINTKLRATVAGTDKDENVIAAADIRQILAQTAGQTSSAELMEQLVGVDAIRDKLFEIINQIEYARKSLNVSAPAMHMRFEGAPGTGKTTVARIVGQMMKERGILSKGFFFEHTGGDFMGMYVGHTVPKTLALCRDAYGSVLFIDEAYTLADSKYGGSSFQKEAVNTLIAQMENHRSDLVVIMAGYTHEMDTLMKTNPGLESRMPFVLEFPNYTREQLADIYLKMVENSRFVLEDGMADEVRAFFTQLPDSVVKSPEFGNARYVRNVFERTWSKTVLRLQMESGDSRTILIKDFQAAVAEGFDATLQSKSKRSKPGFRLG